VIFARAYVILKDGRKVRVQYWEPLPGEWSYTRKGDARQKWGPVVKLPEYPVPQGLTGVWVRVEPTWLGRRLGVSPRAWWSP
jgi:hypothetical protein